MNNDVCHCAPESMLGKILHRSGIVFAAGIAGISAAPYILPKIGIGQMQAITTMEDVLCGAKVATGAVGAYADVVNSIPVIGEGIVKGGLVTGLVAAGIIVGGRLAGTMAANNDRPQLGKIAKGASNVIGVALAVPAMVPAVKHGLKFMFAMQGMPNAASEVDNIIGDTGNPMPYGAAEAYVSLFASHTGCIISAVAVSVSMLLGIKCNKPKSKFGGDGERAEWSARTEPSAPPPVRFM